MISIDNNSNNVNKNMEEKQVKKDCLLYTSPFMLFSTMPVLLGQFIGNFNNFGIFYFLRGGHISMSKKWKFGRMMDTGITYLILTAVAFVFFSRVSGLSLIHI